jgi:ketosteroid isomerase-like protein
VTRADVDRWLQAYVDAWKSYDRDRIGALFCDDVEYRYHPYDEPIRGRDDVVDSWLGVGDHASASTPDAPGTYEAEYRTIAVDADTAVALGTTSYRAEPRGPVERVYENCFVIRFDSTGRCRKFTEWYMQRPGG